MAQASPGLYLERRAKRLAECARKLRGDPTPQTIRMVADELDRLAQA